MTLRYRGKEESEMDRLGLGRVGTVLGLGWGGGGGEGEKDVSRVCAVGTEAQLASVCMCVCLKEE